VLAVYPILSPSVRPRVSVCSRASLTPSPNTAFIVKAPLTHPIPTLLVYSSRHSSKICLKLRILWQRCQLWVSTSGRTSGPLRCLTVTQRAAAEIDGQLQLRSSNFMSMRYTLAG
jgi:hypothetical protein